MTTKIPRMCKAINESGIYWPETLAGKLVERKCPKGMIGKLTHELKNGM